MPSAFLRLSQSLQYFGQVMPAATLPAALSAFQSTPQARSRATMACRPVLGFAAVVAAGVVVVVVVAAGFAVVFAAGVVVVVAAGVAAAGVAAGVAVSVVRARHSFWKSRYFLPSVCFAAFMVFHSSAQAFMRLPPVWA